MRALLTAAFGLGFVGVLIAAFGAHALDPDISEISTGRIAELKDNWRTGTSFLFFHVLAALACSQLAGQSRLFLRAGMILLLGGALFSFGVWISALSEARDLGFGAFGVMAPVGGLTMMAGWLVGAIAAFRLKSASP